MNISNEKLILMANRSQVEKDDSFKNFVEYRFNTIMLFGDYTIVQIPCLLASEQVARYELYKILKEAMSGK